MKRKLPNREATTAAAMCCLWGDHMFSQWILNVIANSAGTLDINDNVCSSATKEKLNTKPKYIMHRMSLQ